MLNKQHHSVLISCSLLAKLKLKMEAVHFSETWIFTGLYSVTYLSTVSYIVTSVSSSHLTINVTFFGTSIILDCVSWTLQKCLNIRRSFFEKAAMNYRTKSCVIKWWLNTEWEKFILKFESRSFCVQWCMNKCSEIAAVRQIWKKRRFNKRVRRILWLTFCTVFIACMCILLMYKKKMCDFMNLSLHILHKFTNSWFRPIFSWY
jgi:hypothetical protein